MLVLKNANDGTGNQPWMKYITSQVQCPGTAPICDSKSPAPAGPAGPASPVKLGKSTRRLLVCAFFEKIMCHDPFVSILGRWTNCSARGFKYGYGMLWLWNAMNSDHWSSTSMLRHPRNSNLNSGYLWIPAADPETRIPRRRYGSTGGP